MRVRFAVYSGLAISFLLLLGGNAAAAPANDAFASAAVLTSVPGTTSASTVDATLEDGEPQPSCAPADYGASVWYRYTSPTGRALTVDTAGSSFDTVLAVYAGTSLGGLTEVACNDDFPGSFQSRAPFQADPGVVYYIQAASYRGPGGSLTLTLAPAANDAFTAAAVAQRLPFADTADTTTATLEAGEPQPCRPIGRTVWYRFTAPAAGAIVVDTAGSNYDTVLAVYTGSALSALTTVDCVDDLPGTLQARSTFTAAAATVYYIQAAGFSGAGGQLKLTIVPQATLTTALSASKTNGLIGEEVTVTVRVANSATTAASIDGFTVTMPFSFSYVAGSSTIGGAPVADPTRTGTTRTWSGSFQAPAGGSVALSFRVRLPALPGISSLSATARTPQAGLSVYPPPNLQIFAFAKPLVVTATAQGDRVMSSARLGYGIRVSNPNPADVLLRTVEATLPSSFAYVPGSTTFDGISVTDNTTTITGRRVVWTDQIVVPGSGVFVLTFMANTGTTPGTFTIGATATPEEYPFVFVPAVNAAPVTVVVPLVATKLADASTAGVGDTDGYTITIHNPNTVEASLARIVDVLPPGFSYRAPTSGATTANPADTPFDPVDPQGRRKLVWEGPFTIAPGGRTFVHFDVVVSSSPGVYRNDGGAIAKFCGADPLHDRITVIRSSPSFVLTPYCGADRSGYPFTVQQALSSAPITVGAQLLGVSKRADPPVVPVGGTSGFTITVSNPNRTAVGLDSISDQLPSGFAYERGSTTGVTTGDPIVNGRELVWPGPFSVPPQGAVSISLRTVAPSSPGIYLNAATATTSDPAFRAGATEIPVTVNAPLTMRKTADAPSVKVAGTNGYAITVSNPNPWDVSVDEVSDELPSGFSYRSRTTSGVTGADATVSSIVTPRGASTTLTWTGPFLVPGRGSVTLRFGVTVARAPGRYFNVANATSSQATVVPTGQTAPVDVTADPLVTTKVADASTAGVGEVGGYTITIANPNPVPVRLTSFTDTLPAGFRYFKGTTTLATTADPVESGRTLTWNGTFDIGPNDKIVLHFCVYVADVPGAYTNVAGGSAASGFTVASTPQTARITVTARDLVTTKSADDSTAKVGKPAGYTITVVNPNPVVVRLDSLTDTLPEGFSYIAGSTSGATTRDATSSGRTLTWSGPVAVPAAGSISLHFSARASGVPGDYLNSATAAAAGFVVQPTGPTAKVTVRAVPLVASKVTVTPVLLIGEPADYSITINNPNAVDVVLDAVYDDLPPGFAVTTASQTFSVAGNRVTFAGPLNVPANGDVVVTLRTSTSGSPGRYFNAASAEARSGFEVTPTGPTAEVRLMSPTALAAEPLIADLVPGAEVRGELRARLTTSSGPVPDRLVVFTGRLGVICGATTDAQGFASCSGLLEDVYALADLGFSATFAGDDLYKPSSARGPLLRVAGLDVPGGIRRIPCCG